MRASFHAFALCALCAAPACPAGAQAPAPQSFTRYQPLAPTAVRVSLGRRKLVPGNLVGQFGTPSGKYYVVQTRHGQIIVDQWQLLGLCPPVTNAHHRLSLPANIHSFR